MRTLYGIQIPDGARQVEVRPVLGRGQARLLFRGPVEQDGVFITEDSIADAVAHDSAFWAYIEAKVKAGAIPAQPNGWAFRLSVSFQDQSGAHATLCADTGTTSKVTSEAWDFWRAGTAKNEEHNAVVALSGALQTLAGKAGEQNAAVVQAAAAMAKDIAIEVTKAVQGPLVEMAKLVTEAAKRAEERADGMAVDLFKQMSKQTPAQGVNNLGLVRDLLGVAKEVRNLVN